MPRAPLMEGQTIESNPDDNTIGILVYTQRESNVGDILTARYAPAQNGNCVSQKVICEVKNNFVF